MTLQIQNDLGKIILSNDAVATLAGLAATECFGVVGMAGHTIKDGIGRLLGKDALCKGVEIDTVEDDLVVKVHIIVAYGTKISVIADNVIQQVEYTITKYTDLKVKKVQVIVQDVRLID